MSDAPNPFEIYRKFVKSVTPLSFAAVDFFQATFNVTGALTATTAIGGATAAAIVPPIGVAIVCLGTVALKVHSLVSENDDFKEILYDIHFVLEALKRVNPCTGGEQEQDENCKYVSRHLLSMTEILDLFLKLETSETRRIITFTPVQFTEQLLREFTLLNAGLTVLLLDFKFQQPVEAIAVLEAENEQKLGGGGELNLDDPELDEQVSKWLGKMSSEVDEIIVQNNNKSGGRRTRQRRSRKNKRTRRKSRR
jgi:hypothetical protein